MIMTKFYVLEILCSLLVFLSRSLLGFLGICPIMQMASIVSTVVVLVKSDVTGRLTCLMSEGVTTNKSQ